MRWTSSDGISAMPPPLYADRFLTFVAHEVLHAELAPEAAAIDERWRAGGWLARCKQLLEETKNRMLKMEADFRVLLVTAPDEGSQRMQVFL